MPLIAERSLWDWAEKIAAHHDESFALVLAEIVAATDRGEVAATVPSASNEDWRKLLPAIVEAVRIHAAIGDPLPRHEGIWTLTHRFMISASEVERWLAARLTAKPAGDAAQSDAAADTATTQAVYRTGLPGKPSSWYLIEAECRRRYAQGARHPTIAEWARILIAWLQLTHKDAPAPTVKTVSHRLSGLLRELARG
jgi:hypothetical protein